MEVTPRCRPVINQPVKELERCLRKEFSKAVEDRDKEACQGESTRAAQSLRSRLPSLGEGRYREAFDLGKCVMKVARHFDGARSNALESQAWQNIREMGDPRVMNPMPKGRGLHLGRRRCAADDSPARWAA